MIAGLVVEPEAARVTVRIRPLTVAVTFGPSVLTTNVGCWIVPSARRISPPVICSMIDWPHPSGVVWSPGWNWIALKFVAGLPVPNALISVTEIVRPVASVIVIDVPGDGEQMVPVVIAVNPPPFVWTTVGAMFTKPGNVL